jgi:hypothetical protein
METISVDTPGQELKGELGAGWVLAPPFCFGRHPFLSIRAVTHLRSRSVVNSLLFYYNFQRSMSRLEER